MRCLSWRAIRTSSPCSRRIRSGSDQFSTRHYGRRRQPTSSSARRSTMRSSSPATGCAPTRRWRLFRRPPIATRANRRIPTGSTLCGTEPMFTCRSVQPTIIASAKISHVSKPNACCPSWSTGWRRSSSRASRPISRTTSCAHCIGFRCGRRQRSELSLSREYNAMRTFLFLKTVAAADPGRRSDMLCGLRPDLADRDCRMNRVLPAVPGLMPEPIWDVVIDYAGEAEAKWRDVLLSVSLIDPVRFVELSAQPVPIIDGPETGIRILSLPRRKAGMSVADFSHHYRHVHGALVAKNEAFVRWAKRYVQHHSVSGLVTSSDGFLPYDGISEFRFESAGMI